MSRRLADDVDQWTVKEWNHTLFVRLTRRMLKMVVSKAAGSDQRLIFPRLLVLSSGMGAD
jgi:hypothetical protein